LINRGLFTGYSDVRVILFVIHLKFGWGYIESSWIKYKLLNVLQFHGNGFDESSKNDRISLGYTDIIGLNTIERTSNIPFEYVVKDIFKIQLLNQ